MTPLFPRPVLIIVRCCALLFALSCLCGAAEPVPLPQAHAHNDYAHPRPLLDALQHGFCSIEADIYLVEGQLLVAHDLKDTQTARTLEALYLDPLRRQVQAHGGRVYPGGPVLTLLVDVKSEAVTTYAALDRVLQGYADILTIHRNGKSGPGAVSVIISGNRARAEPAAQLVRYAAIDGRTEDLEKNVSPDLVPWISVNWATEFNWRWTGEMPAEVRTSLAQLTARVHAQGRQLRFWNTPDRPGVWRELQAAGVDLIGTDDLAGLAGFLRP
ncbi:MAG: phosphatidylinositol-specific phospholipase C/glycerophosphodiester phosphodiesterase family protein [Verrucomicrobiota bacterium]